MQKTFILLKKFQEKIMKFFKSIYDAVKFSASFTKESYRVYGAKIALFIGVPSLMSILPVLMKPIPIVGLGYN